MSKDTIKVEKEDLKNLLAYIRYKVMDKFSRDEFNTEILTLVRKYE